MFFMDTANSDARRLAPEAQEALRLRAAKAVAEGGRQQAEVAAAFGVTRQALGKWVKAWREGGPGALAARRRGRKAGSGKLLPWQAATVCNVIRDRHPDQLRLPFALWTSDAVRLMVRRKFGVEASSRTVRRWLRRWGFTPQKPKRRAYERDPEAVRQWLEEGYPAVRRRAKRENAAIYWADEMGIRSDCQAGRAWAPKGRTPAVPGAGKRFGANVLSAITNRGRLHFMVFKGRFQTPVFLRFLRRLLRQEPRKVFLVVDGHSVHRSRATREWVERRSGRVELFFLPGYSPDLNPDEMLNNDVKANAVGRKRPKCQAQMMRGARRYLERRRRDPETVKRYFHEESVRYAAG